MPHTDFGHGRLFYTVSKPRGPSGHPPLILVHGAGGSRLHWPAELRRLPGAAVYSLDLPGHGRSDGPGHNTIQDYAEAVAPLCRSLGPSVIVGHSMGGAIALTLALDSAELAAGLVLVATGARLRVAPAILEGISNDLATVAPLITRLGWSAQADRALVARGLRTLLETDPAVLLCDFLACDRFDVMDRLSEIGMPCLVLAGDEDLLTPPKYARFLADCISGAESTLLSGAGHMVMLERPAETAEAVLRFLARVSVT